MSELISEIKKAIGYSAEPAPKCRNCKFSREDDGVIDRTWHTHCTFAGNLAIFQVDPDTRCNNFKRNGDL